MTEIEAKKTFEKQFPDREIEKIGAYKGGYILVAPGKDLGLADTTNPIYFISSDGKITRKSPTEDFQGISKALMGG